MNSGNVKIENIAISFRPKASNIKNANRKSEAIMQTRMINLYRTAFPCTKSNRKYA
jgi:hypothetical protein